MLWLYSRKKCEMRRFKQTGDQDFTVQLSSIQASKPDLIYAPALRGQIQNGKFVYVATVTP